MTLVPKFCLVVIPLAYHIVMMYVSRKKLHSNYYQEFITHSYSVIGPANFNNTLCHPLRSHYVLCAFIECRTARSKKLGSWISAYFQYSITVLVWQELSSWNPRLLASNGAEYIQRGCKIVRSNLEHHATITNLNCRWRSVGGQMVIQGWSHACWVVDEITTD